MKFEALAKEILTFIQSNREDWIIGHNSSIIFKGGHISSYSQFSQPGLFNGKQDEEFLITIHNPEKKDLLYTFIPEGELLKEIQDIFLSTLYEQRIILALRAEDDSFLEVFGLKKDFDQDLLIFIQNNKNDFILDNYGFLKYISPDKNGIRFELDYKGKKIRSLSYEDKIISPYTHFKSQEIVDLGFSIQKVLNQNKNLEIGELFSKLNKSY